MLRFYDQYANEIDLFWNTTKMYVPALLPWVDLNCWPWAVTAWYAQESINTNPLESRLLTDGYIIY
jgi:hypothetical protein